MWELATKLLITKGVGQALYRLNSFDYALLNARIANYNHSLQSSIIPPRCTIHTQFELPPEGAILPTILSRKHGVQGEKICAGLALGENDHPDLPGLVYEATGSDPVQVEHELKVMLNLAALRREWSLKNIQTLISHTVVTQPHGCVIAAAVLLP